MHTHVHEEYYSNKFISLPRKCLQKCTLELANTNYFNFTEFHFSGH